MTTKVIILAAGFGTRLEKYTKDTPKPLLPIKGRPLLEYTIFHLSSLGFNEIGINTHYKSEQIANYIQGIKSQKTINIFSIYELQPTGTAGAIAKFRDYLKDSEDFIVIYGDILTDLDYNDFLKNHKTSQKMATICIHQRNNSNSFIEFDNNRIVTRFIERPSEEEKKKLNSPYWVNSAIYCFKNSVLKLIPDDEFLDLPKDIFPKLLQMKELACYPLKGSRIAIDDEEKYISAIDKISEFHFNFDD